MILFLGFADPLRRNLDPSVINTSRPPRAESTGMFSTVFTDLWLSPFAHGEALHHDDAFVVTVNPDLSENSRLMVLETPDGKVSVALTPAMATAGGLKPTENLSETMFRRKLAQAGITLHGADYLFAYLDKDKSELLREATGNGIRQLAAQDEEAFAAFRASSSEQDMDDAYVELDHWAVFGAFVDGRLVCAASMYPWNDSTVADLGVLTLPSHRGQGHARRVVRAICRHAAGLGYEPQYRCQLDNAASSVLAKSAGLTLFGKWDVVSLDSAA
ncbi:GNAT family N-acetyltransferase [Streptomyces sp. NPDC002012]|uniref:GNAT family N-acetyltransferase n=1 Tax=Streptomyces sp. NPDC002012 TaxID=3154532 RepID=UPI0033236B94